MPRYLRLPFLLLLLAVTAPRLSGQSIPADAFAGLKARRSARRSPPAASSIAVDPANGRHLHRPRPAACGRRPTPAPPGRRSSTARARTRSAASRSTRRTRTSSGSAPARTTASAASATATASTRSTDGGKIWKNVGLKTVRAHRQDPDRPARLATRLRRGPGAALGAGRRPRPVQDHRRRQDLEQGPRRSTRTPASPTSSLDPRNPDVLSPPRTSAAGTSGRSSTAAPRARIYRSTDGGKTWTKINGGPAAGDLGRIGLAIAPTDPDVVYAIVEAADRQGRHLPLDRPRRDLGEAQRLRPAGAVLRPPRRRSEERRPHLRDERLIQVSDDGGKTLAPLGERCEARRQPRPSGSTRTTRTTTSSAATAASTRASTAARTGSSTPNLPVTQFYDVAVRRRAARSTTSTAARRTTSRSAARPARAASHGIIEPGLVRHRRAATASTARSIRRTRTSSTRESAVRRPRAASTAAPASACGIQPQPGPGEPPLRWNWDSPLIISPHTHTRLYFAANRLFRSDDRGDSWKADQPRPDAAARPQQAAGHGQGLGRRTRSPSTSRRRSTATASPSPSRRRRKG